MPAGLVNQTYSIQKIWGKQAEVLRMFASGIKPDLIASTLDLHKQTVYNICNSDLGRQKIAELQGERDTSFAAVQKHIQAMQPLALEILEESLTATGDFVNLSSKERNRTALQVLAMGGHGAVSKNLHATVGLSEADRQEVDRLAMEIQADMEVKVEDV